MSATEKVDNFDLALQLARENRELKAELERANKTIAELRYQIRCWMEIR